MAQKPNYIDLGPVPSGPFYNGIATPRGISLPSPRLELAPDTIPPELSPLDFFAHQSRLLAKQLKENANRESRLPPLAISDVFSQPRPTFLRSASADQIDDSAAAKPDIEQPSSDFRPKSIYPQLSSAPAANRDSYANRSVPNLTSSPHINLPIFGVNDERLRGRRMEPKEDFGGARRTQSPAAMGAQQRPGSASQFSPTSGQHMGRGRQADTRQYNSSSSNPRPSTESTRQYTNIRPSMESSGSYGQRRPSTDSARYQSAPRASQDSAREQIRYQNNGHLGGVEPRGLVPPRSPFAQRTPSIRSVSGDSEDDSIALSSLQTDIQRKLSTSSALSSPNSPFVQPIPRSPSICSDFSANGSRLSRPHFNFSRPLSRASEVAVDAPSRQASGDSQPSFILADDTVQTPISILGDEVSDPGSGAQSYVYSRFSLPRGKMLQRNSGVLVDGSGAEISWEQPIAGQSNVRLFSDGNQNAPPSPPLRPSTSSGSKSFKAPIADFAPRRSEDTTIARSHRLAEMSISDTVESISSNGTIKPTSQPTIQATAEGSAEYHLEKGIECHEKGSVNESTYHLRLAARGNHPTGMLLYALACRHGWGMRPNQKEGVQWLRKAADHAQLEIADDEETVKGGKNVDFVESKTRKAQFALSIYELGVSHMNGWGIEQDKVLALRCFEIAGTWGDADALAEAGFCYAQGVGCKKDLKKSARFYRMAEKKGISMVGNSWIHKKKYQDDDDASIAPSSKSISSATSAPSPEKKRRDKSRTRTIFGRKKSSQG